MFKIKRRLNSALATSDLEAGESVEKNTFKTIFIITVIILMVLPFVTTFNEFLTRIVENIKFYKAIEDFVVPYEIKLISVILKILGIQTVAGTGSIFSVIKNGAPLGIMISWNCIGWQSLILLIITLFTGLQGSYTKASKLECLAVGILGTFLMNIFRISLVVVVLYYFGKLPAVLFHDYGSTIMIIIWLFFFWWLSYSTILVPYERNDVQQA